jgi:hypothetical protein
MSKKDFIELRFSKMEEFHNRATTEELQALALISCEPTWFKDEKQYMLYETAPIALEIIKKALTPPTEDEVCRALSKELGQEIMYINNGYKNGFANENIFVVMFRNERICFVNREYFDHNYNPKTLELISRFYESEATK